MDSKFKITVCFLVLLVCGSCSQKSTELNVMVADALVRTAEKIKKEFMKIHPETKVITEHGGSVMLARKVQMGYPTDVMLLADYQVFDKILIPDHFDCYITFARNKMVLGYTDTSKYTNEINNENWYKILLRKDVNYGHTDPNKDPCGYRTMLVWKLADIYYKEKIDGKKISSALINKRPDSHVRADLNDLVPLIESLELDYAFMYRSYAEEHNLKYINLPEKIDLSNPELAKFYQQVKVEVTGSKHGDKKTITGTPIVFAIGIAKETSHYKEAIEFVKFVLSEKGQEILENQGFPPVTPRGTNDPKKLPPELIP